MPVGAEDAEPYAFEAAALNAGLPGAENGRFPPRRRYFVEEARA